MRTDDRGTGRWLRGLDDESFALIAGAIAFVVGGVVAGFVFWGRELAIDGRGSLGDFTAIASAVAATVAFAVTRTLPRRTVPHDTDRAEAPEAGRARYRWFDLVALSLAHGVIALLGWIGIATVMEHSFLGATVYASPAVVIAAAATALSAYLASLSGTNVSPRRLSIVLAVFLVVGMTTAMLSSTDPLWWQMNLSALGITHDISSLTFNLTLIVSGVLVTTIARLGTATLPSATTIERRRQVSVRVLFVLLGVFLACVGLFPVDRFFLLHNTVATGMTVVFAVLVVGLPWLIPSMPRAFVILGFVYIGVVIALVVLFAAGLYNLTAVELVSAIVIFSWIILFLRNVEVDRDLRPIETER
ncbi:hypothetical protein ACWGST_09455 [Agromyces sp. NPDC055520]